MRNETPRPAASKEQSPRHMSAAILDPPAPRPATRSSPVTQPSHRIVRIDKHCRLKPPGLGVGCHAAGEARWIESGRSALGLISPSAEQHVGVSKSPSPGPRPRASRCPGVHVSPWPGQWVCSSSLTAAICSGVGR